MKCDQQPHDNWEYVSLARKRHQEICRRVAERGNAVAFNADERELFKDIMANESSREQVREN